MLSLNYRKFVAIKINNIRKRDFKFKNKIQAEGNIIIIILIIHVHINFKKGKLLE